MSFIVGPHRNDESIASVLYQVLSYLQACFHSCRAFFSSNVNITITINDKRRASKFEDPLDEGVTYTTNNNDTKEWLPEEHALVAVNSDKLDDAGAESTLDSPRNSESYIRDSNENDKLQLLPAKQKKQSLWLNDLPLHTLLPYMTPKDISNVACCARNLFDGQVLDLNHVPLEPPKTVWRQCVPVGFLRVLERQNVQVRAAGMADIDARGLMLASEQEAAWKRLRKLDFQLLFPPPFTSPREAAHLAVKDLAKGLERCPDLKFLTLRMVALQHSPTSMHDALQPITKMTDLQTLEMACRFKNGSAAPCSKLLWEALDSGAFKLKVLGLVLAHHGVGNVSELGDQQQVELSRILQTSQNDLTWLKLAFSGFLSKSLVEALPTLPNLTNVTLSKLQDVAHTCENISKCALLTSLSMYFVCRELHSTGLDAFRSMLPHLPKLTNLHVEFISRVGPTNGLAALGRCFGTAKELKRLTVGMRRAFGAEGLDATPFVISLADSLTSGNGKNLDKLGLSIGGGRLDTPTISYYCDAVSKFTQLKEFDLHLCSQKASVLGSGPGVGDEGGQALGRCLQSLTNLIKLDISSMGSTFRKQGMEEFCLGLMSMPKLQHLILRLKPVSLASGNVALCKALPTLTQLKSLTLGMLGCGGGVDSNRSSKHVSLIEAVITLPRLEQLSVEIGVQSFELAMGAHFDLAQALKKLPDKVELMLALYCVPKHMNVLPVLGQEFASQCGRRLAPSTRGMEAVALSRPGMFLRCRMLQLRPATKMIVHAGSRPHFLVYLAAQWTLAGFVVTTLCDITLGWINPPPPRRGRRDQTVDSFFGRVTRLHNFLSRAQPFSFVLMIIFASIMFSMAWGAIYSVSAYLLMPFVLPVMDGFERKIHVADNSGDIVLLVFTILPVCLLPTVILLLIFLERGWRSWLAVAAFYIGIFFTVHITYLHRGLDNVPWNGGVARWLSGQAPFDEQYTQSHTRRFKEIDQMLKEYRESQQEERDALLHQVHKDVSSQIFPNSDDSGSSQNQQRALEEARGKAILEEIEADERNILRSMAAKEQERDRHFYDAHPHSNPLSAKSRDTAQADQREVRKHHPDRGMPQARRIGVQHPPHAQASKHSYGHHLYETSARNIAARNMFRF